MKTLILLLLVTSCASKPSIDPWARVELTDEQKEIYNEYEEEDLQTQLKELKQRKTK